MSGEMGINTILLLTAGFYVGLLAAKCGMTFDIAISPFTGTAKLFGRMIDNLDKKTKEQANDAENKETKRRRPSK